LNKKKDDEVLLEKILQELFARQFVMGFDVGQYRCEGSYF